MNGQTAVIPSYRISTTARSNLTILRNEVAANLQAAGKPWIVAPVGFKYRPYQLDQLPTGGGRVVFMPGQYTGSVAPQPRAYGTISRSNVTHDESNIPRQVASWVKTFTISIWAPPGNAGPNEGDTVETSETMLEDVVREVYLTGRADVRLGDVTWLAAPADNGFGQELLIAGQIMTPLYDHTLSVVYATPGNITKTET